MDSFIAFINKIPQQFDIWLNKLKNIEKSNMELGIHHMRAGNFYDAGLRFKIVLFFNKNNAIANYLLGKALVFQTKFEKAVPPLQAALTLKPEMDEARFLLSVCGALPPVTSIPRSYIIEKADTLALPSVFEDFSNNVSKPFHQILTGELARYYGDERLGFNVLTLGTNGGESALTVRKIANSIVGVDPSLKMTALSRNRREEDVLVYNTLVTRFPEDYLKETSNKFDLVICTFYLDNVGDLNPLFAQVKNVLNDGGTFAFNVKPLNTAEWHFIPGTMVFGHSDSYVKSVLEKQGFKLFHSQEVPTENLGSDVLYIAEKK